MNSKEKSKKNKSTINFKKIDIEFSDSLSEIIFDNDFINNGEIEKIVNENPISLTKHYLEEDGIKSCLYHVNLNVKITYLDEEVNETFYSNTTSSFPVLFLEDFINNKSEYENFINFNFLFDSPSMNENNYNVLFNSISNFLESNKEILKKGIEVVENLICEKISEDFSIYEKNDEFKYLIKFEDKKILVDLIDYLNHECYYTFLFKDGFCFYFSSKLGNIEIKDELVKLFNQISEIRLKKLLNLKK